MLLSAQMLAAGAFAMSGLADGSEVGSVLGPNGYICISDATAALRVGDDEWLASLAEVERMVFVVDRLALPSPPEGFIADPLPDGFVSGPMWAVRHIDSDEPEYFCGTGAAVEDSDEGAVLCTSRDHQDRAFFFDRLSLRYALTNVAGALEMEPGRSPVSFIDTGGCRPF